MCVLTMSTVLVQTLGGGAECKPESNSLHELHTPTKQWKGKPQLEAQTDSVPFRLRIKIFPFFAQSVLGTNYPMTLSRPLVVAPSPQRCPARNKLLSLLPSQPVFSFPFVVLYSLTTAMTSILIDGHPWKNVSC